MANPETEERFLPPHPGGGVEGERLVSALVREATQVPLLRPEEEEVEKLRFGSKVMHLNRVGGGAAAIDHRPWFFKRLWYNRRILFVRYGSGVVFYVPYLSGDGACGWDGRVAAGWMGRQPNNSSLPPSR